MPSPAFLSCHPDASNEAENAEPLHWKEESERQDDLEASAMSPDESFFLFRLKAPFTVAQIGEDDLAGDKDPERDLADEERVALVRSPSLAASPAMSRRPEECLKPALNPFHRSLMGEGVLDPPCLPSAREDFWTCSPRAVALG